MHLLKRHMKALITVSGCHALLSADWRSLPAFGQWHITFQKWLLVW